MEHRADSAMRVHSVVRQIWILKNASALQAPDVARLVSVFIKHIIDEPTVGAHFHLFAFSEVSVSFPRPYAKKFRLVAQWEILEVCLAAQAWSFCMALDIDTEQLITKLMATIAAMKRIVKKGLPLTEHELKSLSTGISVIETYVNLWKARSDVDNRLSKNETASWIVTAADRWAAIAGLRRNSAAALLGHLGGAKGDMARARKLSPERRAAIARRAARARWKR